MLSALGGKGYINDYRPRRMRRDDTRSMRIGKGPRRIRRMLIGRELFGEGSKWGQAHSDDIFAPLDEHPAYAKSREWHRAAA